MSSGETTTMMSEAYVGDVTCVEMFTFSGDDARVTSMLAGVGASLHWSSSRARGDGDAEASASGMMRKRACARVFNDARIHGVRDLLLGDRAVCWGERRVGVTRATATAGGGWALRVEQPFAPFASWVHDVRGLPGEGGVCVAIGLSDNTVERWTSMDDGQTWTRTARTACESKCLLYTLALSGAQRWDDLIIAAGTIFNEIQVWGASKGVVRANCVGHEGSLMRVRFSDDDHAVYSASDDRTARVWDIHSSVSSALRSSECIETSPSAVLAGHVARVWDCVRIDGERPVYATAGEDCTVRVWDANRAEGTKTLADGVHKQHYCELASLRGHRGRGIWRVCMLKAPKGEAWLASAGADGSVKLWNMSDWTSARNDSGGGTALRETLAECPPGKVVETVETVESVEMEVDVNEEAPKKRKKKSKRRQSQFSATDEFVRVIRFARHDEMYVATNHGFLYRVVATVGSAMWAWTKIYESEAIFISMHVENYDDHDLILLADLDGSVHIISIMQGKSECDKTLVFQASSPRILMDVFWSHGKVFATIVGGLVRCWDVSNTNAMLFEIQNPYSHRVLAVDFSEEMGLILIGDQKGNACVFDASSTASGETPRLIAQKWSAHDNAASINTCVIRSGPEFVTGGRDSSVRTWSIASQTNDVGGEDAPAQLILNSKWPTPSKSSVLFAPVNENGEVTHVAGYRETDFVVYAVGTQRQMLRIRCQAHSKPSHVLFGESERVVFAHLQGSTIHISTRWPEHEDAGDIPQTDKYSNLWSHGREIHTIRMIPPPLDAHDAPLGIVSGSEDGTVMRLLYSSSQPEGSRVHSPGDICKHPGGRTVKALSVFKESDSSYVLCAGGAKEVLLGFRLTWHNTEANGWDLRSTALVIPKPVDKAGTRAWTKGCGYVQPRSESDQRIMDVVTYAYNGCMRVLYSTSLGAVSVVAMDEEQRIWRSVSNLEYHTCPVLVADVVSSPDATWACSGGTDGSVAVWCVNDDITIVPAYVIKGAHQSGVNALSVVVTPHDTNVLIVVSGGDDQVLRIQSINISANVLTASCVCTFDFAHSSAMRSIWTDGTQIISTSVDQRVKIWEISYAPSTIDIYPRGGVATQAPEPEAIDVMRASQDDEHLTLVVAGRGFELFTIKPANHA